MRELKFRAWVKSEECYMGKWIDTQCPTTFSAVKCEVAEYYDDNDLVIEQYTGLKDKNGKEIYEGDIVRWSFKVDRNREPIYTTEEVKWRTYEEEEWPYSTISGFTLSESEDGYEVIGNIHENQELLEGKL